MKKIKINPKYEKMRSFIERIPDVFEQEGRELFHGRNVIKSFMVQLDGKEQEVVVKRYKQPNFFQKIGYSFFRSTKACRAYEHAIELKKRGISTPEGYGYVETRKNGLIDYCYFISDVDNSHPISEQLSNPNNYNKTLAMDYARFVAQLHRKGIIDIDLNSGNVLYREQADGHYDFSLIDTNRMKFYPKDPPRAECMENLTRFSGQDMIFFGFVAREYIKSRGWNDEELQMLLKVKIKHDKRWTYRKKITRLFKGKSE